MPTKVLIISDTHCESMAQLPQKIVDEIKNVDAIVHAGDYTHIKLVEELAEIKTFYGVYGNMDSYEIKNRLPEKLVINLDGFKIGVTHPPEGGPPYNIKRRVKNIIKEKTDVIIFGHTHKPEISEYENILYLNPGSAKPSIFHPQTFILLNISDKLQPKIVKI
ncbi:MAG: metallophosphoesterase family protein [Nitrososphaeria archaeon]